MKVFFLSEIPCALTINGAYLGLVDHFERSVELDPAHSLFCEFAPCGPFLPVRFSLDDGFLVSPPTGVQLYYTENAVAVYVSGFLRTDQSLRVIWQKRFRDALLTLVQQGKLQLFYGGTTAKIIELPDALADSTPEETKEGYLLRGESAFALISFDGELAVLSEGNVLSCDGSLKAEVPFHDSLGHTALCEWKYGELVACSVRTRSEPTEATFALALFESALIGADCTPFLAENLIDKATALKEYLGDFRSVVLTGERDKVGLVYERKERVFDVRYFHIEITDGKVSNIKPL